MELVPSRTNEWLLGRFSAGRMLLLKETVSSGNRDPGTRAEGKLRGNPTVKTPDKAEESENQVGSRDGKTDPADQDVWTWADPKTLKVKPEFQRLIPLQARGELLALEESIKMEGCRDPLLIWKD